MKGLCTWWYLSEHFEERSVLTLKMCSRRCLTSPDKKIGGQEKNTTAPIKICMPSDTKKKCVFETRFNPFIAKVTNVMWLLVRWLRVERVKEGGYRFWDAQWPLVESFRHYWKAKSGKDLQCGHNKCHTLNPSLSFSRTDFFNPLSVKHFGHNVRGTNKSAQDQWPICYRGWPSKTFPSYSLWGI